MRKLLEAYFDNEIIFPYMYLDDIYEQHIQFRDANIYMVMLAEKYQVLSAKFVNQTLVIIYECLESGVRYEISNIELFNFFVPDNIVNIKICDCGIAIEVIISTDGIEFIKRNYKITLSEKVKISIYDLINMSNTNIETFETYEVLYIGQSFNSGNGRTIFDRLSTHEKILKICREYNMKYRDKELVIFLLHSKSKLNTMLNPDVLTSIYFGNSYWQTTDEVGEKITDATVTNIIEAMLIYHFKPEYNIKLKNSIPNLDIKTYSELKNAGVHEIQVGLNLYLEPNKNCIRLFTKTVNVVSKLRILKCSLENLYNKKQSSEIEIEDIDGELYRIINL